MIPTSTAITVSVTRAFHDSDRLKAGTPFDTASTPVDRGAPVRERAHQEQCPEGLRRHGRGDDVRDCGCGTGERRTTPTAMRTNIDPTNT